MTSPAVKVTGLSKRYRIGVREQGYKTFREAIVDAVKSPFNNLKNLRSLTKFSGDDGEEDIIWALRDINFEVKRGEVVGIIGANGAGKSTLLKVLSRITEPTTGFAEIRGRVSSLLEVGTGFHPELTGRENIYLNGTVLGMRKKEIDRKFDEIVDFSGVAKFIDTPVKRYSSGMKVRLAFAVAAHLEPEILIIDEVLSVGDAAFQKKCLGKMGEVAKGGRTVLFVSHNMGAVNILCDRVFELNEGNIVYEGDANSTIKHYLAKSRNSISLATSVDYPANLSLQSQIRRISIKNSKNNLSRIIDYSEFFYFEVEIEIREKNKDYYACILLNDVNGNIVIFTADDDLVESKLAKVDAGKYKYLVRFPSKLLKPGEYSFKISLTRKNTGRVDGACLPFEIQDHLSRRGINKGYRLSAVVAPEIPWVISRIDKEAAQANDKDSKLRNK